MTDRLDKLRRCKTAEELDGFLMGCRDYGGGVTADELKAAQELRKQLERVKK